MVTSTDSRRKSIAVAHEGRATLPRKKRAHSIGASKLSPLARSRLSIGNVKGILKSRTSLTVSARSSPSSQSRPQSQSFGDDHTISAESMDLTQDLQVPIHENNRRKSMGRRVSFKQTATLRYFDKPDKDTTTSSQGSPGELAAASSDDDPLPAPAPVVNDENAYPGANRRRSSVRKSIAASEDMDVTSASAGAFIADDADNSALLDQEMDFDDGDMDMTQTFSSNLQRRSSVGAAIRAPLSQINPSTNQDESLTSEQSFASSDGDRSEPMEFTVPLNRPLRPPANQDEAWLQLVRATHSGEASLAASDDMDSDRPDVEDIVARDNKARYTYNFGNASNDSMSISDASFGEGEDVGEQTLNLSKVMGRVSFGGDLGHGRPSVASSISMDESEVYGDIVPITTSTPRVSFAPGDLGRPSGVSSLSMDESEVYGDIVAPTTSTPRPSLAPQTHTPLIQSQESLAPSPSAIETSRSSSASEIPSAPAPPSVFRAPSPKKHPVFTPKSPAKPAPKQFSAAFAPPVARPTPRKTSESTEAGPSQSASKKRERTISAPSDRPSPAKRQAMEAKWSSKATPTTPIVAQSSPARTEKPRALSPDKRAPFQATAPAQPKTGIRRPSGYFALRKSLGPGLASASSGQEQQDQSDAPTASSPPKKSTRGRASMSSGPSDAWTRFDKSGVVFVRDDKGKGKATNGQDEEQQALAKESEVPATSQPINAQPQQMEMEAGTSTPKTPVVDLSALLEQTVFGDEEEAESREGPTGMDTAATEHWRDAIPEDGYAVEESPPISIEQFFEMTGIGFVELTAPRRSLHPSQISSQKPRNPTEASLAECANVMAIELPQLVLYSRVCQDIEERIQKSKADFEQMEDEAAKMTPELFLEYSGADQESQKELVQCLNLIRKNTRLRARSDWYDWKLEWIEDLKHTAENAFTNLQNDARSLEKIKAKADEIVPQLQQEYDEIMRELEAEKVEVAQIEECDQDYLNELKNTIAEQNVEVESLRAEVKEADDQLHWLEERLENIAEQKREATAGIAEANRALHLQTNSTGAEVFRLKNELKALEDLHMFHVSKVQSDTFEYIYASEYHVIIPCRDYYPVTKEIDILRLPEMRTKSKDSFPRLTSFLLSAAKEHVRRSKASTVRHIVQVLADFWSSGKQLRNQILQLSFKYPVEIEARQTPEKPFSEFAARTMILFPAKKAKAYVSFVFDSDTFSRWPLSVNSLRWEVQIGYGSINEQSVVEAISERMSEVSPSHTYACMIDACIEVQEACG